MAITVSNVQTPDFEHEFDLAAFGQKLRNYLFYLLARPDYSQFELSQKINTRFYDELKTLDPNCEDYFALQALITTTLNKFSQDGYQSDERFAFSFVRSKYAALNGPIKIRYLLQSKKISSELIERALAQEECDWFASAERLKIKKFGEHAISDMKMKQKAWSYLSSRGFSGEPFKYALAHPKHY